MVAGSNNPVDWANQTHQVAQQVWAMTPVAVDRPDKANDKPEDKALDKPEDKALDKPGDRADGKEGDKPDEPDKTKKMIEIDTAYYEKALPIAQQQLGLAGLRLAQFLNTAYRVRTCPK